MANDSAHIPSLSDLTPAWWTEVLRRAGVNVTVTGTQAAKIGTGQLGQNVRFQMQYADGTAAPATFVGKFPSDNMGSVESAKLFGAYRREISFYRELANRTGIAIPPVIFAEFDSATEKFILIMGDLAPAVPGDQTKGVTLAQAGLALDEAAKLHASHWGNLTIADLPWLMGTAGAFQLNQAMMVQLWARFLDRFGDKIGVSSMEVGETIVDTFDKYMFGYQGPRCLIHNDFRPDNMAFAGPDGGRPITVFDWQTVGVGCGMNDVAYFMGGALSAEMRKLHEPTLVKRYHEALTQSGVLNYSLDQAWHDYRRYSGSAFTMAMAMSMMVERTERGDAMFIKTLQASAQFVRDVDGLSLLKGL